MKQLIDKLHVNRSLHKDEFVYLLDHFTESESQYLFEKSREMSHAYYGNKIYIRGLIEFSNYCRNDCYYCGIRKSNALIRRYRLSKEEILSCCQEGYHLGFRTFVLQGGEDGFYSQAIFCDIIENIHAKYPDCAITLSIGERSYEEYEAYFKAGANRFLLRHETAGADHYKKLHPPHLSLENRMQCLFNLKDIGYQAGTGFMVGSPFQTTEDLAADLLFIRRLNPQMVGIGPFITHQDTPFSGFPSGSLEKTLLLIGLLRLILPGALIPATTALGTIHPSGRELGILAGANVVMPNLSPVSQRKNYALYDNKICTGDEAASCIQCLDKRLNKIGYEITVGRGDSKNL